MVAARERKLIIKRTFLEYVCEGESSNDKPSRQRSWTEPALDSDVLYDDIRELIHGSDSGGSDSDSTEASRSNLQRVAEPVVPKASLTLHSDIDHPFVQSNQEENRATAHCTEPPATAEQNAWAPQWSMMHLNGVWWSPIPCDGNTGVPITCYNALNQSRCSIPFSPAYQTYSEKPPGNQVNEQTQGEDGSAGSETRTSVMLRGLPETYTRSDLLQLLNSAGFFGRFDFVYLPIDFKKSQNLGYAIVNAVSPAEALRMFNHFQNFSDWKVPGGSACTIMWCSPQQGLESHVGRYRNSPVMHESVPEAWRPLLLSRGVPLAFPAPTMKIKAPRLKGIH